MKVAIVGGGAAGFFAAVCIKEQRADILVDILERSARPLAKVRLSGGGRCNLSNTFNPPLPLPSVYPRGHRLMKRLLAGFGSSEACRWFECHGVKLMTQSDGRIFPATGDSATVADMLLERAHSLGVRMRTCCTVGRIDELRGYDAVLLTTGGLPRQHDPFGLEALGHKVERPLPSLFALNLEPTGLGELAGITIDNVVLQLAGSKMISEGGLLLTHRGISGPAALRLSSYGARWLAERDYRAQLVVRWYADGEERLRHMLGAGGNAAELCPLPRRLWTHLMARAGGGGSLNRLVNVLTSDTYQISGRAAHKDEFVTCGGVALGCVNARTMESRVCPRLYFAGEVLDIDGVTGGYNLQAAWTTAYHAAMAICGTPISAG